MPNTESAAPFWMGCGGWILSPEIAAEKGIGTHQLSQLSADRVAMGTAHDRSEGPGVSASDLRADEASNTDVIVARKECEIPSVPQ